MDTLDVIIECELQAIKLDDERFDPERHFESLEDVGTRFGQRKRAR